MGLDQFFRVITRKVSVFKTYARDCLTCTHSLLDELVSDLPSENGRLFAFVLFDFFTDCVCGLKIRNVNLVFLTIEVENFRCNLPPEVWIRQLLVVL